MTDYVDEALTVAIAAEQRAAFLNLVSNYRGSLETLHNALKESTKIHDPKDAWKLSGKW